MTVLVSRCVKCKKEVASEIPEDAKLSKLTHLAHDHVEWAHAKECDGVIKRAIEVHS